MNIYNLRLYIHRIRGYNEFRNVLIGFTQPFDKLVFVEITLSLRDQSADWSWQSPVEWNQVTITSKSRGDSRSSGHFSVHFPSNRGIATPLKRTGSQ